MQFVAADDRFMYLCASSNAIINPQFDLLSFAMLREMSKSMQAVASSMNGSDRSTIVRVFRVSCSSDPSLLAATA